METVIPAASLPRLLTAREVSEQTGVTLPRVYELTRAGEIPHVRLGRAVRYPAPALREWIAAGGTGAWTPPSESAR